MHAFGSFGRREKDIALHASYGVIGHQEAEAVAMDGEAAGEIFGIVANRDEVPGAEFDELAFIAETVERLFKLVTIFALEAQFANELFIGGAGVREMADVIDEACVVEGLRG
jgi:hypothetical protein